MNKNILNPTGSNLKDKSNFSLKKSFLWRNWFIYIVLVFLIILFSILNKNFFSISNFSNIARQAAMVSIIGFGMTFVITSANIDLSVGSLVALVSVIAALSIQSGMGVFLSSVLAILVGLFVGFINGILVTKAKIPSFLVTLGMLGIVRGVALTLTNTKGVPINNDNFKVFWGGGDFLNIPISLVWVVIGFIICIILYSFSVFGKHVKATGGNITATKFSGINTDSVILKSFLLLGFLTAIAGLIMASRIGTGRPEIGNGLELDAIAAVILGGTSLYGGKGSIVKTFIGALIITIITNGLIILGVGFSIQQVIKGAIIIGAASISEKN
ncbi:MAG: ABC transporter permease [Candidatus Humimicrobiaceae bacterium]